MIIKLKQQSPHKQIEHLTNWLTRQKFRVHLSEGEFETILGVIGDTSALDVHAIEGLEIVEQVIRISEPFKAVNRKFHPVDSVMTAGGAQIGGGHFALIAGPCSVESYEQIMEVARAVKAAGATMLRGGAFKPRTSPYDFQGLKAEGLELLRQAKAETGLPIVSEIMNINHLDLFNDVDIIQVGARNMQNFSLLKRVGRSSSPVLLKRGNAATLDELLMAAEYILSEGNYRVILCERGIRTFADHTRNTLDLSVVPAVQHASHLPIIVDPSHGTGRREKVIPMSRAAVAVGADGLIIEVHSHPEQAMSDGNQSLDPVEFEQLMREIGQIAPVLGRSMA